MLPSLILRDGQLVCSGCGEPRDRNSTWCPTCRAPLQTSPPAPEGPSAPSVIIRNRCTVCSVCGTDVAPKSPYCPHCRASFDGSPVPPSPPVKYRCLSCNADLPAGSAFCPKCGIRITHYYPPGEQLPAADANRQQIAHLLQQQQIGFWLLAIGLVLTFFGWFVCR